MTTTTETDYGLGMERPCWILLAPGNAKQLEPTILKVAEQDPEDGCPWELVDGEKGYVAIIEEEPGSEGCNDAELARALTKKTKKRAYLITTNDNSDLLATIDVFANGKWEGRLKAGEDDALATLGFRFDWMDGGKKVALRLEPPMVTEKAGEAMIWDWSVSQWQQMVRQDGDWYALLDGVGRKTIDQILAICADDDAKVRLLAVTMLERVSYYDLKNEKRLKRALAVLDKLAGDRSKKVSAVAIGVREDLVRSGESEAVRAEFPWLLNYDETHVKEALALLDEDRPLVHRYIYHWFDHGIMNREKLPKAAVAKLKQLAKTNRQAKALLKELAR